MKYWSFYIWTFEILTTTLKLHENCHDWRGVTALLLYQISTRNFKLFTNNSGLKIRKSSTDASWKSYFSTFQTLSTLTQYLDFFFHKNFLSDKAKSKICTKKLMHYLYSSITSQRFITKLLNKSIHHISINNSKSFYNFYK